MESTFSIEKFSCFAVGFRWKDQDASRARIFSWSAPRFILVNLGFKNIVFPKNNLAKDKGCEI